MDTAPLLPRYDNAEKPFSVTPIQLCEIIDSKSASLLADLGGTRGICKALHIDPTMGLRPDESFDPCYGVVQTQHAESFQERKRIFGRNVIPDAPEKTILSLIWSAYNDLTLSEFEWLVPVYSA